MVKCSKLLMKQDKTCPDVFPKLREGPSFLGEGYVSVSAFLGGYVLVSDFLGEGKAMGDIGSF